ncbi:MULTISPECIES: MOSC domain-containing protein [Desulfovibrio]|uniref:MOSC domain-containing protein YiiM n=3 Tax=Desulfovibrio TaxID=872 RepID=A0AA94HRS9_DESDE|nr:MULTISPECIES: MOSC domain-containing protein [Desulfovibrio]ATD82011.1 MOSC domain-containing protein [Desulfovibrio sp. G11]MDY0204053.1 MOSC domain-containing protein [Desulfovibrio desulfuricans]SFW34820.1 MOSC domain-containing protein YiiM [Desulfovibrio desulfuricans]SPD34760.1 Pyruvate kinase-like, insert domain [Desulfovibrio sp. G11]
MGIIKAICVSSKKGTAKQTASSATLVVDHGIEGDAHAGKWHRQVSLLSWQAIEAFKARGAIVTHGCFGENLVVDGIDFAALPVGTRLSCNTVLLEVSQIGKECHNHCQIYHTMGDCIMPRQGVFARVLKGGLVRPGDVMDVLPAATDCPEGTAP